MNINAATTDYFFPHCLCFMLPSSHFQKGIVEGGSRLTKRWIKVCTSATFCSSLCCSPHFLPLFSLCMPRTYLLLALSTRFLFTGFVQCSVFDISVFPVFGSRHCSDTCKMLSTVVEKNIYLLCLRRHNRTSIRSPVISLGVIREFILPILYFCRDMSFHYL